MAAAVTEQVTRAVRLLSDSDCQSALACLDAALTLDPEHPAATALRLQLVDSLRRLIVIVEKIQARLPKWMRESAARVDERREPRHGLAHRRRRDAALAARLRDIAAVLTVVALWKLPGFLRDPWEYDFDKLGSKGARQSGACEWSREGRTRSSAGKMNLAGSLVLADTPEQVPLREGAILANDAADPKGALIEGDARRVWRLPPGHAGASRTPSSRCSSASASASRRACSRA